MKMGYRDVMGTLYSARGLRFGGFQVKDFLNATEVLESQQPGAREGIVAEAHYLCVWLHGCAEIAFYLALLAWGSLGLAALWFVLGFVIEIVRFYTMGAVRFISRLSQCWEWIKFPLILGTAILLWSGQPLLVTILIVFLIAQGWLKMVSTLGMLPLRAILAGVIYRRFGGHWHNMEGLTMNYVINAWRDRLSREAIRS